MKILKLAFKWAPGKAAELMKSITDCDITVSKLTRELVDQNPQEDKIEFVGEVVVKNKEPSPDLVHCNECGWNGLVSDCDYDEEGDWETGYYFINLCPDCGSGDVEYNMTPGEIHGYRKNTV
jgi:hypothetical protein